MLERIRTATERKDQGFTLIELLVVMIIIGILAAIAIPVFMNQQVKARETSAKADVSTIGKEIAAYYVDGDKGLTVAGATAGGTWTITADDTDPDAPDPQVASGQLSDGNKASGAATYTGGVTKYCVAVMTQDDTTTETHAWRYVKTAAGSSALEPGKCSGSDPA